MVVYEIKKPTPTPSPTPKPIHQDLEPVAKVRPTTPVDQLLKRWRRDREQQGRTPRQSAPLTAEAEKDVRTMIGKVNDSLAQQAVPIRLVLIATDAGFLIDVYDCHDEDACRIVADLTIDLADLPLLLRNLDQEAGILIDTVS